MKKYKLLIFLSANLFILLWAELFLRISKWSDLSLWEANDLHQLDNELIYINRPHSNEMAVELFAEILKKEINFRHTP